MQKLVRTYAELEQWVDTFQKGSFEVFIVEGSPGVGKSTIVTKRLTEKFRLIEGRVSALCLYEELYEHRDGLFIIDDVDDLYRDKAAVNLLKCLCQTREEKTVVWNTYTSVRSGRPTEFTTKSKVAILTNRWETLNKHIGAVEDRGLLIKFQPNAEEVHRYVRMINGSNHALCDDEVINFMDMHLPVIVDPSIRHYRNAQKIKDADMPWEDVLLESFRLPDSTAIALKLLRQSVYSQNQRAALFAKESGKSARTFWRIYAELKNAGMRHFVSSEQENSGEDEGAENEDSEHLSSDK